MQGGWVQSLVGELRCTWQGQNTKKLQLLHYFLKFEVQLSYKDVLVSGVWQSDSFHYRLSIHCL